MRFIVDEDVPKSVADFLAERGHELTLVLDVLLPGSADYLVARWAHESEAIVVTCNLRHFRPLLRRPHYSNAGLLGLPHQAIARERLEAYIELIESEGASDVPDRVWIEVRESTALISR